MPPGSGHLPAIRSSLSLPRIRMVPLIHLMNPDHLWKKNLIHDPLPSPTYGGAEEQDTPTHTQAETNMNLGVCQGRACPSLPASGAVAKDLDSVMVGGPHSCSRTTRGSQCSYKPSSQMEEVMGRALSSPPSLIRLQGPNSPRVALLVPRSCQQPFRLNRGLVSNLGRALELIINQIIDTRLCLFLNCGNTHNPALAVPTRSSGA